MKTLKQYMEEYRQKIGKKTEEFKETTANVNKKSLVIENNPQSQKQPSGSQADNKPQGKKQAVTKVEAPALTPVPLVNLQSLPFVPTGNL